MTVSWQVTGAVSVTVRRDGQQVSTDAAGVRTFTVADKHPITWAVAASNRAGAISEEDTWCGPSPSAPLRRSSLREWKPPAGCGSASWCWPSCLGWSSSWWRWSRGVSRQRPFIAAGILAPVLAFLFAALFNFTAGYWLAASLTILLVLAVVTWV